MEKKWVLLDTGIIIIIIALGIILGTWINAQKKVTIKFIDSEELYVINDFYKGNVLYEPKTPTKEGYIFLGWYLNDEKYDFSKIVTNDLIIEAKWQKIITEEEKQDDSNKESSVNDNKKPSSNNASSSQKPIINNKPSAPSNNTNQEGSNSSTSNKTEADDKKGEIKVSSISINKMSVSLNVGQKETLIATINPSNATNKSISWNSSNPNVVSVNNGVITAVSGGTATITATVDGKRVSSIITVFQPVTYSYEIVDVPGSTTGQCYIYIKSSEGKYVSGKVTITYSFGGSEEIDIPVDGYMMPNKTVILSIKGIKVS